MMIIKIGGAKQTKGSPWSKYVLQGTKQKPRDPNKIEIMDGDLDIGDKLVDNNPYQQTFFKIVLSFKGKPSREKQIEIYQEWKRLFFEGFSEEEYHIDAVRHSDTDDEHWHLRIPTQNLYTNTQLQLYWHQRDLKRLELIRDYLDIKYDLESPRETTTLFQEEREEQEHYINSWREEYQLPILDFKKRAYKREVEKTVNDIMKEAFENGALKSQDDIKTFMEDSFNIKVIKFGYDKPKNFYYMTLTDNDKKKVRVRGDFYSKDFWKNRETDSEAIITNTTQRGSLFRDDFENIKDSLEKEQAIRRSFLDKRYSHARKIIQQRDLALLKQKSFFTQNSSIVNLTTLNGGDNAEEFNRADDFTDTKSEANNTNSKRGDTRISRQDTAGRDFITRVIKKTRDIFNKRADIFSKINIFGKQTDTNNYSSRTGVREHQTLYDRCIYKINTIAREYKIDKTPDNNRENEFNTENRKELNADDFLIKPDLKSPVTATPEL